MKRRLFNLAAAASLVLFVATAALWVRGYFVSDYLRWQSRRTEILGASGRGALLVRWSLETATDSFIGPHPLLHTTTRPSRPVGEMRFYGSAGPYHGGGFDFFAGQSKWSYMQHYVVPNWSLMLFAALLPAWQGRRVARQRRRQRRQQCLQCGYDLRATPGRCPECGAVAKNAG